MAPLAPPVPTSLPSGDLYLTPTTDVILTLVLGLVSRGRMTLDKIQSDASLPVYRRSILFATCHPCVSLPLTSTRKASTTTKSRIFTVIENTCSPLPSLRTPPRLGLTIRYKGHGVAWRHSPSRANHYHFKGGISEVLYRGADSASAWRLAWRLPPM